MFKFRFGFCVLASKYPLEIIGNAKSFLLIALKVKELRSHLSLKNSNLFYSKKILLAFKLFSLRLFVTEFCKFGINKTE